MCKGSATIAAILLLAGSAATGAAQGGGGRSDSVRTPNERRTRSSTRIFRTDRNSSPKIRLPATGRVTIRVNEGSSKVRIFRDGNPIETIDLPDRSTSLIIRNLEVGSYTVTAAKAGFHEESREIEVEKNESRRVSIDLRPMMAVLSVASNVPDAKISIDKFGEFESAVRKALVRPDRYKVTVSRRGYVSRTIEVVLKAAGSEEIVNVILDPLRIDAVLDLAFEHIENEKLSEAEALALDVLELNPQHARANLALGMAALNRPDIDRAVDRIMTAISNGETFVLPVIASFDGSQVAALFKLDRRSATFESAERPGLNFSIGRDGLTTAETDGNTLTIAGESDFHGRPIRPRLHLISPLIASDCRSAATRRTCSSDVHLLRALLAEWRG